MKSNLKSGLSIIHISNCGWGPVERVNPERPVEKVNPGYLWKEETQGGEERSSGIGPHWGIDKGLGVVVIYCTWKDALS